MENKVALEWSGCVSETWYKRTFHVNIQAMGGVWFQLTIWFPDEFCGMSGNYDPSTVIITWLTRGSLRSWQILHFMLRDWKLSASTYELLRSDYSNDRHGVSCWCSWDVCSEHASKSIGISCKDKGWNIDNVRYSVLLISHEMHRCSEHTAYLTFAVDLLKAVGIATESAARWQCGSQN